MAKKEYSEEYKSLRNQLTDLKFKVLVSPPNERDAVEQSLQPELNRLRQNLTTEMMKSKREEIINNNDEKGSNVK